MLSARVAASEGALSCPATQRFIPVFTPGKTYQQHACPRARVLFQSGCSFRVWMLFACVAGPLLAALRSPPLVSRQQAVLLGGRAAGAAAAWRRAVPPAAAFTEEDCASCTA